MIIVQLLGGLGNQLFQYATARHLAERRQVILKLDITEFEMYKLHRYSLQHFALPQEFATSTEIATLQRTGLSRKLIRASDKLRLPFRLGHVIERNFDFDPTVLNAGSATYLEGYWQSERYFAAITAILRDELQIITAPTPENEQQLAHIDGVQAVSLHVRRGDYASNPLTLSIHGLTPLDYYQRAVAYLAERVSNLHLFVFSDDPAWVQQNLHLDYPITYVTHNDATRNYEDLRLMSRCQHHIIANSSFSWWGAWLNPNPHKIVIAPTQWGSDPSLNTVNRTPATWLRL